LYLHSNFRSKIAGFEGINEEKAIGRLDEAVQRLAVELRSRSGLIEWEQLKQELHGLKFFSASPLLRALQIFAAVRAAH
jgi:hypothetical protein